MQPKTRYSYLELVEDHKDQKGTNLFEKILVANSRARDLQQLNSVVDVRHRNPGYAALHELKQGKIIPKELESAPEAASIEEEEEEEV